MSAHYGEGDTPAAVSDVTFSIAAGEVVGLTGASGCGKSTTALAVLGLLPPSARVNGSIAFAGRDLTRLPERERRRIRGASISIVFQEPGRALNPVMAVGPQIAEIVRAHEPCSRAAARERAMAAMHEAGLGDALPGIYDAYPHEISGGEAQRILIAQAVVCRPALVIADEPTASLDSVVRTDILRLITQLRERHGIAFLLISHNALVLQSAADRVITMAAGRLIPAPRRRPHPVPRGPSQPPGSGDTAVVSVRGLAKCYRPQRWLGPRREAVAALAGVELSVPAGHTLGLAGESGAGKSTLARCLAGLEAVDQGEIRIDRQDIARARRHELRRLRRQVQLIHQDSASAFNPRFTAAEMVAEPLTIEGACTRRDRSQRALELMSLVGLAPTLASKRPGELSGGERQRLGIARALAVEPRVLILDEPFSSLDAANVERITSLLEALQRQYHLTYICISHDLGLLAAFAPSLAVLERGRIVEAGPTARLLTMPQHPATRRLVAAATAISTPDAALAG